VSNPPRPELALTLGITGHRVLEPATRAMLSTTLDALLARVAYKVRTIGTAHTDVFAPVAPALTLLSPLAEGTDQIAAEAALAQGYALHAVLPFARAEYARDFEGAARTAFDSLLARAEAVWELPSERALGDLAYMRAGDATIAQCELLIAVWDGHDARGTGGTADVIDAAVRRGVPVIHLPTDSGRSPAILWSGFDGVAPERLRRTDAPSRSLDGPALEQVLDALLAPPEEAVELMRYMQERERRTRSRPEWPLFLAIIGAQPMRRSSFLAARYAEAARQDWEAYHAGAWEACGVSAQMEKLESAFAWADGLAQYYAHVFRSGVVLNFAGAALAVLLSLVAVVLPAAKLELLVSELVVTVAVIANTAHGTRRQWHRRWLDYRFLAEQLRPLRSLKLLGAANSAHPKGEEQAWNDWYARAFWRELGSPPTLDSRAVTRLAHHIAVHELDGQVSYHRSAAHRMHLLDHRLHKIGVTLFYLTILLAVVALGGLLFAPELLHPFMPVFSMLAAALPTLGGAIFGIRGAGDFSGTAGRSAETARRLAHVAKLLHRPDIDYPAAVRATEEAASVMLADLGEWRSTHTNRKLAIPS